MMDCKKSLQQPRLDSPCDIITVDIHISAILKVLGQHPVYRYRPGNGFDPMPVKIIYDGTAGFERADAASSLPVSRL
jgi:hypothetical protein